MSKVVDDRVVTMRFDNSNFEGNVKQSMSTLERLKNALKFKGSANDLSAVGKAAKTINMNPLANSVETVRAKFSALQVVGVTALANIANSAVNTGKRMVDALTFAPIRTGFQEYELKMNSVQTIMANTASKGTTMKQVTAVLDELNHYADKTIYNFAEMTRNIGTFTAAGVGLEDSASAIQGIANLAAMSGSNSQQASTAMYQLSQALAAGTVKLMDWNSVVNAGMGGEKFQNALKQTAREMGIAVDDIIAKNGSFRESLQDGWLSADVLNTTLKKFTVDGAKEYAKAMMDSGKYTQEMADSLIKEAQMAEDAATKIKTFSQLWDTMQESVQSGWAETWEIVIGDFEDAKGHLTTLYESIAKSLDSSSERRNDLLRGAFDGWDQITKQVGDAGVAVEDFEKRLVEVGKAHGVVSDEIISKAGSVEKSLRSGWASPEIFKETILSFTEGSKEISASTDEMKAKLKEFQTVVDEVWSGKWKTAPERYQLLADAGYDYAKVQELVNKTVDGHRLTLEDLSVEQAKAIGFTEEQILVLQALATEAETTGTSMNFLINNLSKPTGRELMFESLLNIIEAVRKAIQAVKDAWHDVFPPATSEQIYGLIEGFHSFTEWLIMSDDMAEKLRATLRGLFSIIKIITTAIGAGLKLAFEAISSIIGNVNVDILGLTASIGDAIFGFSKWITNIENLKSVGSSIIGVIQKLGQIVLQLIDRFIGLDNIKSVISDIGKLIDKVFSGVGDKLREAGQALQDFIGRVKQLDISNISFETVKDTLVDFKDNVVSTIFDVDEAFGNLRNSTTVAAKGLSLGAIELSDGTKQVISKLKEFTKQLEINIRENIGIGEILSVGFGVVTIKFMKSFSQLLENLSGPMGALSDMFRSIGRVFSNFATVITDFRKIIDTKIASMKADMFYTIAKGIGILALSFVALAAVNPDKVAQAGIIMGGLAGGLLILSAAFNKIGGEGGSLKLSAGIISIAFAMKSISKSMTIIGQMSPGQIISSIAGLAGAVGALRVLITAFNKVGTFNIADIGMVLSAVIAIKGVVSAMQDIGRMDVKSLVKSIIGLVPAILSIKVLLRTMRGISVGAGAGVAIVGAVLSLKILVSTMKDLASIDASTLSGSIDALAECILAISALMLTTRLAGENAGKGGVGVAAMMVSMMALAKSMQMIAKIDPSSLDRAKESVEALMAMMAVLTAVSGLAGKNAVRAGAMIMMISASLVVLSGAMLVLSTLKPDKLQNAVKALATLQSFFAILIAVTHFAKDVKGSIVAITTAIAACSISLAALSMIDASALQNATIALTTVMGVMSLMIGMTHFAKGAAKAIIPVMLVLAEIASIFVLMSEMKVDGALQNGVGISAVLASMSLMMAATSKMKPMTKGAFATIQSIVLVVAEISAVMAALSALKVDVSVDTVKNLGLMMTEFAGLFAALSILSKLNMKVSKGSFGAMQSVVLIITEMSAIMAAMSALNVDVSIDTVKSLGLMLTEFVGVYTALGLLSKLHISTIGVLTGAGGLVGVITIIGGFMTAVGALVTYVPQVEQFLNKGIPVLNKIASGIGEFIGNISGGFLEGVSTHLPEIGKHLQEFMSYLAPFAETASTFKAGSFDGLKDLGAALTQFTVSGVIDDLSHPFSDKSSLAQMSQNLGNLAKGLTNFNDNLNISEDKISVGIKAAKSLAEVQQAIAPMFGAGSVFTGQRDLGLFGTQLKGLAKGLSEYSQGLEGIVPGQMALGTAAAKELANLQSSLPTIGGMFSEFKGTTDLTTFGDTLKGLGEGLRKYSDSLIGDSTTGGLNLTVMHEATAAAQELANVQASLPAIAGIQQAFGGSTNLSTFGTTLKGLGEGIVAYSTSVKDFTKNENFDASVEAIRTLSSLQTDGSITRIGGMASAVMGNTDLGSFGESLSKLGEGLFLYNLKVFNSDFSNIEASVTALKQIASLQEVLAGAGNSGGFISYLAGDNDLETFGTNLTSLGSGLSSYSASIKDIDTTKMSQVKTALGELASLATDLQAVEGGVAQFTSFGNKIEMLGTGLKGFGNAIADADFGMTFQATTACRELIRLANEMGNTNFDGFSRMNNALKSFSSDGINSFINAFQNASGRVTTAVNSFINAFVNGINNGKGRASTAVQGLMDAAVTAINNKQNEFNTAGQKNMDALIKGVESKSSGVKTAFTTVIDQAATAVKGKYTSMYNAGAHVAQGLINGINSKKSAAVSAARSLASAVESAARVSLDINSPSKVFYKIGQFVDAGLAKGIDAYSRIAEVSSIKMANSVIRAMQDALLIKSPSKVAKDEVGRYIVEGIAEGITNDMSAEEAAKKKADNIINAFQEEIDRFELDKSTLDAQEKIWEALNPDAKDKEKAERETMYAQKKLLIHANEVKLAQGEYEYLLARFGKDSKEAHESYNKYLSAQSSMIEVASEIVEKQDEAIKNNEANYVKYQEWFIKNGETAKKLGYTTEQMKAAAAEYSGYILDPLDAVYKETNKIEDIIREAMESVGGTYAEYAKTELYNSLHEFAEGSTELVNAAITKSEKEAEEKLKKEASETTKETAKAVKETTEDVKPDMEKSGTEIVDTVSTGVKNQSQSLYNTVDEMVAVIKKKFEELDLTSVGEKIAQSLINGLKNKMPDIQKVVGVSDTIIVEGAEDTAEKADIAIESGLNPRPKVSPVIDLTKDVVTGLKRIGTIIAGAGLKKQVSVATSIASSTSSTTRSPDNKRTPRGSSGTTVNYTQNNYSPKSLSRTEIYRQTSNQLSALKGR